MQALTTFGQDLIDAHKPVFIAGGEFLAGQFAEQERERGGPAEGYGRRPLIALRVKEGNTDMNFKPGWKASRRQDGKVIEPGVLLLDRVHVESRWSTNQQSASVKMTITEDKAATWVVENLLRAGQHFHLARHPTGSHPRDCRNPQKADPRPDGGVRGAIRQLLLLRQAVERRDLAVARHRPRVHQILPHDRADRGNRPLQVPLA